MSTRYFEKVLGNSKISNFAIWTLMFQFKVSFQLFLPRSDWSIKCDVEVKSDKTVKKREQLRLPYLSDFQSSEFLFKNPL